jgi:hypothetical protein
VTITIAFKPSFTGGELTPALIARTDLEKYNSGLRKCQNAIVQPFGGVIKRAGLEYVANTKGNGEVRLIPFQFNVEQSYMLEFGNGYMRVIKDAAPVVLPSAPSAYAGGTTYAVGDHVADGGVNYYSLQSSNTGHTPASSPTWWYPLTGSIVEIKTPYTADVDKISVAQSADTMYIAHPSHTLRKLVRTDHHKWTISTITFGSTLTAPGTPSVSGTLDSGAKRYNYAVAAYDNFGVGAVSGYANAGSGEILTWTAASGGSSEGGTVRYYVYRLLNGVYAKIGFANGLTYTLTSADTPDFTITAPDVITDPTHGSNPTKVAMFEQRLIMAGTSEQPQTFFGSRTGSFENFNKSYPLQDDDAYEFTIASGQVNAIRGVVGHKELIILTAGAVWKAIGDKGITPTNIQLLRQTGDGCADLEPLVVGEGILYVQASAAAVKDLMYSLESDAFRSNDLSLLAQHLFENKRVISWTRQKYPYTIVWCVRDDGTLLGLTYERDQEVVAWHQHNTEGTFEEVSALPDVDGTDSVYVVVKRTVNGSEVRTIEYMKDRMVNGDVENSFFVDCGLTYDTPVDITSITQAATFLITAPGHGLIEGDFVDVRGVGGMVELLQDDEGDLLPFKRYLVGTVDGNNFTPRYLDGTALPASGWTAFTSGGTVRKAVTTISGLDHLEGKTVSILANGCEEPQAVVTSGDITLESPASIVHVGLPFTSLVETLELTADAQQGTIQDKARDVVSIVVYLDKTRSLFVGPDENNMSEFIFRENENFDTPTELFTGAYDIATSAGNEKTAILVFKDQTPLPFTILAVIPRIIYGTA